MSQTVVRSRCECQAVLTAALDANHHVLEGWAAYQGIKERAPAHSIGVEHARFDVGWLCPFCGRNTLRAFDAGAAAPSNAPAVNTPIE